ncbi:endonuclease/exonuclease/phosphatase family protein [Actinoplanes sp. NBRC 101535]|uniref:endonuclease/exonuclease/phosphatase family protein n=1 Tax=Actinoplanes sp. NBRC 101535 TaxID=3032196 RepID=UPI0024A24D8F|nr:endonuclease/exonuclease/phosphatase family protein [Actinoplanes sp. NBRC 101535]GLY00637.1 hypothetical protein Acsp01_10160 [Actinoplanes sp. NBRC 101535]
MRRRSGLLLGVPLAALLTLVLLFPSLVPNSVGRLGSLVEAFRPWLALGVLPLLLLAWWGRSRPALLAALLPLAAWLGIFAPYLTPSDPAGSGTALTVVQHNVSDENPDPAGTAQQLAATGADLIGLEEMVPEALPAYAAVFARNYPFSTVQGTVALWSRFPLTEARLLDIRPSGVGPDWNRGLRAVARTPHGDIAVYVAHLPSVRIGLTGFASQRRDESAHRLGQALAAEPLDRIILLGDLNSTLDDRGLSPVTAHVGVTARDFAFSWPGALPMARIDQVMARSLSVSRVWSLPPTGSDHRPVAATLTLP